jgi:hypothetical protein
MGPAVTTAIATAFVRRVAVVLGFGLALGGCSTLDVKTPAVEQTRAARVGPEQAPFRSITGFTPALRCMDDKMLDFGVRDVTMLVEDLFDQTRKVNAGTRDMLISAVSDMTRRSRAIRVNAFGRDSTNAITFLASAQRQQPYETVPQYDIRGSVSQFDENVVRSQKDAGIGFKPYLNLGVALDATSSILGLDLSVLTTEDLSIVPGVTSRNAVAILRQGKGVDADAAYSKFGISYSMSLSRSEGQAQALRGLVELAVVELMGKLTKTPYWSCLGADASTNEEIQREIADWYHAMAATRVELIGFFQHQLRHRGFYQGPVDGAFNPAIDEAIAAYRAALGLSREAKIDPAFFSAYLNADHSKIPRPARPAVVGQSVLPSAPGATFAAGAPSPTGGAAAAPAQAQTSVRQASLGLAVGTLNGQTVFAPGEAIRLLVAPSRDAHVYCYLQDENQKLLRFFPNRFARDSWVRAGSPLELPGTMRFALALDKPRSKERIFCFATAHDVGAKLPAHLLGVDFEPLTVPSLDQVRSAFVRASGSALAEGSIQVRSR